MSRKKTGGRVKGTPNKVTGELRKQITEFVAMQVTNLGVLYNTLSPKEKIEFTIRLLPYIIPKPTGFELDENEKIEVIFVEGKTIL